MRTTLLGTLVGSWWPWLAALVGAALFGQLTAPDPSAAAGGAAEPQATDPVAGDPASEDSDPAAAAAGAPDDADPEDDDDEDAGLPPEVRDNPTRLRTRLRRTQRQLAELRPIAERLRGPNGERVDLEQILYAARQYEEMDAAMRRNPALRSALYGEQPADPREPEIPAFNEADLPFDTTTPEGKYFAQLARRAYDADVRTRQLERRLEVSERRGSEDSVARYEGDWKTAALAAAAKLPKELHNLFVEAVYGNFHIAKSANKLGTVQVQQVINRLLKGFNLTAEQRNRASHAAGARIAESNRRLPQAPRGGAPAAPQQKPAQQTNRTVADVSRDFLKRNAG